MNENTRLSPGDTIGILGGGQLGRMRELQRQCIHVRVDCLHMPIRLHKRVCQIGRQAVIRRTARKGRPVDFDRLLQTLRSVQRRGKASDKFSLRRRERALRLPGPGGI